MKKKKILMVLLSCWVSEGGIQHVNRSLIEFFKAYDKYDITVLILLDTQSDIESHIKHERSKILIKGFAGSKLRFSLRYTKELLSKKYDFIWFDHIHLAPLMIMAIFRRIKYALMIYGADVSGKISIFPKIALYNGGLSASFDMTIDRDTAVKMFGLEAVDLAHADAMCSDSIYELKKQNTYIRFHKTQNCYKAYPYRDLLYGRRSFSRKIYEPLFELRLQEYNLNIIHSGCRICPIRILFPNMLEINDCSIKYNKIFNKNG